MYACESIIFHIHNLLTPARMRSHKAPLHVNGRCRIAKMDTLKLQLRPGKMNCSLALLGRCDPDVRCDRDVDLE